MKEKAMLQNLALAPCEENVKSPDPVGAECLPIESRDWALHYYRLDSHLLYQKIGKARGIPFPIKQLATAPFSLTSDRFQ